ncbi:MAG: ROK family protein, partial [Mariniphaga sp.]
AQNETVAAGLFREFGRNLGDFLAPWVKQFGADCLVLGGNISKSFSLFKTDMEQQLKKHGLNPAICLSKLEEKAALSGSAKLCDDSFYSELINAKKS